MAITISGENNNDRILASDGVIDQISGINIVGLITASHINVGSNIQLGNAGIITATTFAGNLTGNVNSTSPLLLQTGGSERFRITSDNALGIAGANYGSSGQVLTSNGDAPPTWQTSSGSLTRTTANAATSSIANNASGNITITAAKSYVLQKIQTSAAAWVTLYTDSTSRSNDSSRNETTDPTPGSGVIAEVITSGAATQILSPGVIGWNNDSTPSSTVYAKVVNKSGSTQAITVTLHYLEMEI